VDGPIVGRLRAGEHVVGCGATTFVSALTAHPQRKWLGDECSSAEMSPFSPYWQTFQPSNAQRRTHAPAQK